MVVADDDSESDAEIIGDSDERDSDGEAKPKVIKVITRKPPSVAIGNQEPAWHALLRRTPNSRTASISCTVPSVPSARGRAAPMRPVGPVRQQALPQRGQGRPGSLSPSRIVNVPARVLVPRNRLVFPVSSRGRSFTISRPLGRHGQGHGAVAPGLVKAATPVHGRGVFRQGGRAQAVSVLGPRVFVSATGPLSAPEKAVLDGVLDMQEEQGRLLAHDETINGMTSVAASNGPSCSTEASSSDGIALYMEKYGVSPCDTFQCDFDLV
ncbi:uncharacterized protein LOC117640905 isoform X2 [Thrips palmi]|nr:uncharacterized protein LOC117640905 isoform X2 [Thrips palmi]